MAYVWLENVFVNIILR